MIALINVSTVEIVNAIPSIITNKDKKRKRDKLIDLENCKIIEQGVKAINLWNKFIDCLPNKHRDLMSTTPLWLEEIDADYPYVSQTPYQYFCKDDPQKVY